MTLADRGVRHDPGAREHLVELSQLKRRQATIPYAKCHVAFDRVSCDVGTRKQPALLFHDLTVAFPKGRRIVILGHKASGKTTLFDLILSRRAPTRGDIHLNGRLSWPVDSIKFLDPKLTFRQNVIFVARVLGVPASRLLAAAVEFCEIDGAAYGEPLSTLAPVLRRRLGLLLLLAGRFDCHIIDGAFRANMLGLGDRQTAALNLLIYGRDYIAAVSAPKAIPPESNLAYLLYEGRLYGFEDVGEAAAVFDALPVPPRIGEPRKRAADDDDDEGSDEFMV